MIIPVSVLITLAPAKPPLFAELLGVTVGVDAPSAMTRRLGDGAGEVRSNFRQDDGWIYWLCRSRHMTIQAYFDPAAPRRRRIRSITLTSLDLWDRTAIGKVSSRSWDIRDPGKLLGVWEGVRMGDSKETVRAKLTKKLGEPRDDFGDFRWSEAGYEAFVGFDKGKLVEIVVTCTARS